MLTANVEYIYGKLRVPRGLYRVKHSISRKSRKIPIFDAYSEMYEYDKNDPERFIRRGKTMVMINYF